MKIAIRVDASTKIGLGHIKRCLALAEGLREFGAAVLFVTRDLGVDIDNYVLSAGFEIVKLKGEENNSTSEISDPHAVWKNVALRNDALETVAAARSFSPNWLVVDHYSIDASWHAEVARQLGVRIVAIDDLGNRQMMVDVLVDQNINADYRRKHRNCISIETKILGGPRFALLGSSFRKARKCTIQREIRSIGIFMGGVDVDDASSLALEACREIAGFRGAIEVVTTRFNPNIQHLRLLAGRWSSTKITEDLPNLAEFFARHDIQIGAGGGAAWERAAVGAPSLLLVTADNQREVVPGIVACGAALTVAMQGQRSLQDIGLAIRQLMFNFKLRRTLSLKSRRLVDGLGAKRVAVCVLKDHLKLRCADYTDEKLILKWRNHPSVRAVSRESAKINPKTHAQWMTKVLADNSRFLLIGQVGGVDVGVIRFDTLNADCFEVSVYLDPELRGLGVASVMLRAGECHMSALIKTELLVVATVLIGNASSHILFESCGYRRVDGRWKKTIVSAAFNASIEERSC